ncbi:hypothetical protein [Aliikangiella sp. IMCC44632]
MLKKIIVMGLIIGLAGCSTSSPLGVFRGLFGYIEPPPKTTISEELRIEYDRCMKIGEEKNCAQAAFDIVRKVKGLEPRKIPEGYVIILEGDGNRGSENNKNKD